MDRGNGDTNAFPLMLKFYHTVEKPPFELLVKEFVLKIETFPRI